MKVFHLSQSALIVAFAVLLVAYFVIRFSRKFRARKIAIEAERKQAELEREAEERRTRILLKRERDIEAAIRNCPGSEKYRRSEAQSEANAALLNITDFTKISKDRYVAFDLETTGLSCADDHIVEIGAVRVENGQVTAEYSQLVNPCRSIPPSASAVNHITDDMVADKPKIYQVLPAFLSFVGDDVLVAHNARFDARFLSQACMVYRFRAPAAYFDTMSLARYWPESPDKKLSSLILAAGIENEAAHRALGDAKAVAALVSATNLRRAESRKKSSAKKES